MQASIVKAAHLTIPFLELPRYMTATLGVPKSSSGSSGSSSSKASTSGGKGKNTTNLVTLAGYGTTKTAAIKLANVYANGLNAYFEKAAVDHQQYLNEQKLAGKATKPGTSSSGSSSTTTTTTTATTATTSVAPSGSTPGSSGSSSSASTTTPQTGYTIQSYAATAARVPPAGGGLLDSHKVRALVGFLLGLVLGAAIVIARSLMDKRIRQANQAASNFRFPVIVEIPGRPPVSADEVAAPVDVAMEPGSVEAEAFRMLRMSVMFEGLADPAGTTDPFAPVLGGNGHAAFGSTVPSVPELGRRDPGERHIVLITSPAGEETRPAVAANLAAVYAEAGQRVIIASTADLGVSQPVLLGDTGALLAGSIHPVDVEARLERTRVDNIVRLPFTMFLRNSGQLVSRGKELLDAARSLSDVIIVETPGLLFVHHAEALSHAVDAVVVVGQAGQHANGRRPEGI